MLLQHFLPPPGWSVSRGISGQFATESGGQYQRILQINHPDERISRVMGTWVQVSQKKEYQLSPLIKRIPHNLTDPLRQQLFERLAKGQLSKKILSPFEAAKAIQYFQNAAQMEQAALVLVRVLSEFSDHPQLFFDYGFGLYWYYSRLPEDINPYIKVNIRFLQIQIAIEAKDDVSFLKNDLIAIQESADIIGYGKGLISLTLFRLNVESAPLLALQNLVDAKSSLSSHPEFGPVIQDNDPFVTQGIWVTFYKLTAFQYHEWFELVSTLHLDPIIFDPIANHPYIAAGPTILSNLIRNDFKGATKEKIIILIQIMQDAIAAKMYLISVYALKYLIYFYCFELKDFSAARDIIAANQDILSQNEIYRFLIADEFGRHLYYGRFEQEAETQLSSIVEINLPPVYSEKPGSLRAYALLIAEKDPKSANYYTLKALDIALSNQFNSNKERFQLYGEAGISSWLAGDTIKAVELLEQGYNLLNQTFQNDSDYQAAVIRFGSIGQYIIRLMIDGKPPKKAVNGDYLAPERGHFYLTTESLLAGNYYFPERRFIVAFIFQEAFEYLERPTIAKKWALTALEIAMGIENAQYLVVLQKNLFYLIEEGDFDRVFSVFNYLNQYIPLEDRGDSNITAEQAEKKNAIIAQLLSDDTIFYEFVFIPIIYQIIIELITGKIKNDQLVEILDGLFNSPNLKVTDLYTLSYIKKMLFEVFIERGTYKRLEELQKDYSGSYHSQLNLISSLTYSHFANPKKAAELQLDTIQRQEHIFSAFDSSSLRQYIIPFYMTFWLAKFEQNPSEWQDQQFWVEKSMPYFQQAHWTVKLKRLFKTLVHHLNIKTTNLIDEWLDS